MDSGIYIIKNIVNGKLYIGSAVNLDRRFYAHRWALYRNCHRNIYLQRAWNKDGETSFLFEKYLICEKKDLIFYEQLTIDALIIRNGRENIYNISPTAGSTMGRECSEETRRKLSLTSRGRWTGKHHTEETKKKISIGNIGKNKGKIASLETREKMSKSRKGKKFSEEHRKKIGEALRGRIRPKEVMEKVRLSNLGRVMSKETKEKISKINKGKTYEEIYGSRAEIERKKRQHFHKTYIKKLNKKYE